jgi:hypothetical protein
VGHVKERHIAQSRLVFIDFSRITGKPEVIPRNPVAADYFLRADYPGAIA